MHYIQRRGEMFLSADILLICADFLHFTSTNIMRSLHTLFKRNLVLLEYFIYFYISYTNESGPSVRITYSPEIGQITEKRFIEKQCFCFHNCIWFYIDFVFASAMVNDIDTPFIYQKKYSTQKTEKRNEWRLDQIFNMH